MKPTNVFVITDHPRGSDDICTAIDEQDNLALCGLAANLAEFLAAQRSADPQVLILDLAAPLAQGTTKLLQSIRGLHASLPMLLVSNEDENDHAEDALLAGARGFIMRREGVSAIMAAMRRVAVGEIYLSQTLASRLLQDFVLGKKKSNRVQFGVESLSDRELEIFELIGRGLSTKKIAARLTLSVKTIETHRAHIKQKLKIADASELVHRAFHWINSANNG